MNYYNYIGRSNQETLTYVRSLKKKQKQVYEIFDRVTKSCNRAKIPRHVLYSVCFSHQCFLFNLFLINFVTMIYFPYYFHSKHLPPYQCHFYRSLNPVTYFPIS